MNPPLEAALFNSWIRAKRNRFASNPGGNFFRAGIGLLFFAAIIAASLWGGNKLQLFLAKIEIISPGIAANLLGQITYRLFLPLFPLIVISHAVSALSSLFTDSDLPFFHTHPLGKMAILRLRGPSIFFTTSGYLYLVTLPVFYTLGGAEFTLETGFYLTLFLAAAWGCGIFLTVTLAALFRVATLSRLFSVFLAVAGALFVFSFRQLRPEMIISNPGSILSFLGGEVSYGATPAGWLALLLTNTRYGLSHGDAFLSLLIFSISAAVITAAAFRILYLRAWQRSLEVTTRRRGLKARIPVSHPLISSIVREFLSLTRNPTRFSQLALMISLMLLYLYNLHLLDPLRDPAMTPILLTIHVGLCGFILSALGVRFAFPAPSLDGEARWIHESLPVSKLKIEAGRCIAYGIIFLLIGMSLTAGASTLMELTAGEFLFTSVTVALLSPVIAVMAVALGTINPRYDLKNPLQIGFSPEGLLFFFCALTVTAGATRLTWFFVG